MDESLYFCSLAGKALCQPNILAIKMNSYIHLITGGERSGKSSFAERTALSLSPNPVYVATARVWDDEFAERVRRHQAVRGSEWTNIEEEKYVSQLTLSGRVVLIDCVTLWATNFFYDLEGEVSPALEALKREIDALRQIPAHLIIVTNEIGMGGISMDSTQRRFTELQGWCNQHIAALADEVTLMVSGIPVRIK